MVLGKINKIFRQYKEKIHWKDINYNNDTFLVNTETNITNIFVGDNTIGRIDVSNDTDSKLIIGSDCIIEDKVKFLLGIEHPTNHISTFPFSQLIAGKGYEALSKGDIVVENHVKIEFGSIILSGVRVGNNSTIKAGSVVTKDVPPFSEVEGIPARIVHVKVSV